MFKIQDKLFLGFISGVVTTSVLNIVDWISVFLKANKWHIWQIAGSVYFKTEELMSIPALLIGAVTHTSLMGLAGVIICYLLYFTGTEYYLIKGYGVFMIFWIVLFGGILSLGIARIDPVDAPTNLSHLVGHTLGGLITSYLIIKLAEDTVWQQKPQNQTSSGKKQAIRKFHFLPVPARKQEKNHSKIRFVKPKKLS